MQQIPRTSSHAAPSYRFNTQNFIRRRSTLAWQNTQMEPTGDDGSKHYSAMVAPLRQPSE